MENTHHLAPTLKVSDWLNTKAPITLSDLRGKVVVIEAFQMLCPGCVSHGLPQAKRILETFKSSDVVVLGLHSVFEHHDAMTKTALEAFVHEYRIDFPVAIDAPSEVTGLHLPQTMMDYQLRGTPSLIIIDQEGYIRSHYFGSVSDMRVGADIARLLSEQALSHRPPASEASADRLSDPDQEICALDGCR